MSHIRKSCALSRTTDTSPARLVTTGPTETMGAGSGYGVTWSVGVLDGEGTLPSTRRTPVVPQSEDDLVYLRVHGSSFLHPFQRGYCPLPSPSFSFVPRPGPALHFDTVPTFIPGE